ncbi:MAG: hypothetical protein WCO44_13790 [Bacteroidota bacterium]
MNTLKRNYPWLLLFGSLIGLNETLVGSLQIPYHSVVLSTITLLLLTLARASFPQKGTSLVIIAIALVFKLSHMGIRECTAPALLCGPAAMAMLGAGYELFASQFTRDRQFSYANGILSCSLTSLVTFGLFGLLQGNVLHIWDPARMQNYIFARGPLTALASSVAGTAGIAFLQAVKNTGLPTLHPWLTRGLLFAIVLSLWVIGR